MVAIGRGGEGGKVSAHRVLRWRVEIEESRVQTGVDSILFFYWKVCFTVIFLPGFVGKIFLRFVDCQEISRGHNYIILTGKI